MTDTMQALSTSTQSSSPSKRPETVLGLQYRETRWSKIVTISPAQAEQLLRFNTSNRPPNRMVVDRFRRLILTGEFGCTHQGIAFGVSGRLIDGQKRLMACIAAEQPIAIEVHFSVDEALFDKIDQGENRTLGQLIAIDGLVEAGWKADSVAAAARIIFHIDAERSPATRTPIPSKNDIAQVIQKHPLLVRVAGFCFGLKAAKPRPPYAPTVGIGCLFCEADYDLGVMFLEQIFTAEKLDRGDPAYALRNSLTTGAQRKAGRDAFMFRLVRGWNNLQSGTKVRSLYGVDRGDGFPAIIGYKPPRDLTV